MTQHFPFTTPKVLDAMKTLNLEIPFSLDDLRKRYEQNCRIWDPARYAGHTNNPRQYMQMYRKGELKTKEIHSAFAILQAFFEATRQP